MPERGPHNPEGKPDGDQQKGQNEVINAGFGFQADPEKIGSGNSLQSVITAGQTGPFKSDEIEHLRIGKGNHGKIDALASDGGVPDGNGQKDAEKDSCKNRQKNIGVIVQNQKSGGVSAHAEKGGMAEGEHSRIAQTDIIPHGKEHENQNLAPQRLIGNKKGQKEQTRTASP
jgi:hypothetical protein